MNGSTTSTAWVRSKRAVRTWEDKTPWRNDSS